MTDIPLACNEVIHKSKIDVNSKDVEGAAYTAFNTYGGEPSSPENYEEVYHDYIVDKAFGFVITDSYGTVLFSGVVNSVN